MANGYRQMDRGIQVERMDSESASVPYQGWLIGAEIVKSNQFSSTPIYLARDYSPLCGIVVALYHQTEL